MTIDNRSSFPDLTVPWYRKTWGIILLLILFAPVGCWFVWKGPWQRRTKIIVIILCAAGLFGGAFSPPQAPTHLATHSSTTESPPTSTTQAPTTSTVQPTPTPSVVTTAEKLGIRAILTGNVDHFSKLFALGEAAVGTSQYQDASAGLAALRV